MDQTSVFKGKLGRRSFGNFNQDIEVRVFFLSFPHFQRLQTEKKIQERREKEKWHQNKKKKEANDDEEDPMLEEEKAADIQVEEMAEQLGKTARRGSSAAKRSNEFESEQPKKKQKKMKQTEVA